MTARRTGDEWRWVGPDGFEYSGSKEKLCDALSTGSLAPSTPVWRAGFEIWLPAESVPELAEELPGFVSQPFSPSPALKTPPPIGISADAVVVAPPGAEMRVVAPAHPPRPQPVVEEKRSPWLLVVLLLAVGGVAALALVLGIGAIAGSRAKQAAEPAPAAPNASAELAPAVGSGRVLCSATQSKRIAKTVFARVPIVISSYQDQAKLGVGFAETPSLARALVLSPDTLAVEHQKSAPAAAGIVSATAHARDNALDLIVDVEDGRLRLARTFAPGSSLKIGIAPDGIATLDRAGQRRTIWKSDPNAEYTVPRVDGSSKLGHFVALRRGGAGGELVAGWLAPDATARSELSAVEVPSAQLGTPSAAVGSSGVLLAAAARPDQQAPWDLMLGAAPPGKSPQRLNALAIARASVSTQRMSPAGAALSDGRWALQFTERTARGHVVRVALLDSRLEPLTEPVTVSPDGADSGQGELWAHDDRMVSLYLVKVAAGHELWASSVICR
jgi:hypothetical protein